MKEITFEQFKAVFNFINTEKVATLLNEKELEEEYAIFIEKQSPDSKNKSETIYPLCPTCGSEVMIGGDGGVTGFFIPINKRR